LKTIFLVGGVVEIIYCSQCGDMIPPGGVDRGKHFIKNDQELCRKCYKKLPQQEHDGSTIMAGDGIDSRSPGQVIPKKIAKSTRKHTSVKEKRLSTRLHPPQPTESPLPNIFFGVAILVAVLVIVSIAMSKKAREEIPTKNIPPKPVKQVRNTPPVQPLPGNVNRPENKTKKHDRLKAAYQAAIAFRNESPRKFNQAIERFRQLAEDAAGTEFSQKIDTAIEKLRSERGKAVDLEFEKIKQKLTPLLAAGNYDGALAELKKTPAAFEKELLTRLATEQKTVKKQAEDKLGAFIKSAEDFSKAGEPDKGLAKLDKTAGMKYAPLETRIKELRQRLQAQIKNSARDNLKQQEEKTKKTVEDLIETFDRLALAGEFSEAGKQFSAGRKSLAKDLPENLFKQLEAVGKVGGKLKSVALARDKALSNLKGTEVTLNLRDGETSKGKVLEVKGDGFKIEIKMRNAGTIQQEIKFSALAPGALSLLLPAFKPQDADDQIASAILALRAKDAKWAAKALGAARDHALAARYRRQLEILLLGENEAAAKQAWEREIRRLVRDKYDQSSGQILLMAIKTYCQKHGGTDFAKSKQEELEKIRSKVGLTASSLQSIFKGKIVSFDPKTLAIELFYDFDSPEQLADFRIEGEFKLGKGSILLKQGAKALLKSPFVNPIAISCKTEFIEGAHTALVISRPDDVVGFCHAKSEIFLFRKKRAGTWASSPAPSSMLLLEFLLRDGKCQPRSRGKNHGKPITLNWPSTKVYLSGHSGVGRFDDLRISGRLQPHWLNDKFLSNKTKRMNLVYTEFPFKAPIAKLRQQQTARKLGLPVTKSLDLGEGVKLDLLLIPAGEFMMGSKYTSGELLKRTKWKNDEVFYAREHPRHKVRISRPFYLGRTEITQAQWQHVMKGNPSKLLGPKNPVDNVNWEKCQEFVKKLNELQPELSFRLPTEAEWEYACRAGTETPFSFGEKITDALARYNATTSWDHYRGKRYETSSPVGSFKPNSWGLYDMHGNIQEFCQDSYATYPKELRIDPLTDVMKDNRILLRGGWWGGFAAQCRSAYRARVGRGYALNRFGLRIVLMIPGPAPR
jgi:formylglycine-generating enzyme required for sulfatase activity